MWETIDIHGIMWEISSIYRDIPCFMQGYRKYTIYRTMRAYSSYHSASLLPLSLLSLRFAIIIIIIITPLRYYYYHHYCYYYYYCHYYYYYILVIILVITSLGHRHRHRYRYYYYFARL